MCSRGLEDSLVDELCTFDGVESIRKNKSGANFNASPEIICRLNLWARIPSRILIQLGKTQINNADELLIPNPLIQSVLSGNDDMLKKVFG